MDGLPAVDGEYEHVLFNNERVRASCLDCLALLIGCCLLDLIMLHAGLATRLCFALLHLQSQYSLHLHFQNKGLPTSHKGARGLVTNVMFSTPCHGLVYEGARASGNDHTQGVCDYGVSAFDVVLNHEHGDSVPRNMGDQVACVDTPHLRC